MEKTSGVIKVYYGSGSLAGIYYTLTNLGYIYPNQFNNKGITQFTDFWDWVNAINNLTDLWY